MLEVGRRDVDAVADALIDLVELAGGERLRVHDLLRQHGRELAEETDPAAECDDTLGRLAGWYAHGFAALAAAVPGFGRQYL